MKCKKAAAVIAGVIMAMGAATPAFADADAHGAAIGSPGVLSGNVVQIPIHVPINVCGNSVNIIGALNPAAGNVCINA
ncbi:chaplin [Streptomyces sp. NPDC058955]|uniref:chaplin n=1 Tax=unclassified Streptomyces TaxID=2593676 RepID=UPI0036610E19